MTITQIGMCAVWVAPSVRQASVGDPFFSIMEYDSASVDHICNEQLGGYLVIQIARFDAQDTDLPFF